MAGTIQEIAERTGVSRGTVDRVLNHRGRVRPEVAVKVTQVAEELGYTTRSVRKATAAGWVDFRKKIGVVTQLSGASFMLEIMRGIDTVRAKMENQGVHVILRESAGVDEEEQLRLIEELVEEGIDGLAIMPVDCEGVRERLNRLTAEEGIPVVTFNSDIVGAGRLSFVGLDNRRSGSTAAGLMGLMMRGEGRVLCITGNFSNSASSLRMDGFIGELKKSFPAMEIVGVQSSFDRTDEVEQIIVKTMTAFPDLGGILVVSGGQAGVVRAFEQLKPAHRPYVILYDRTPKNVSFLQDGVVDFLIDQDGYHQGHRAISLLADKLCWNKEPEAEYMYTDISIKTKYNL
ncbi:MAG: LacI family DNA-binding transcriptional regulator [Lachnospiraceae bacterium]|nr:LacI family DNA-binding transcriptional regulator [Lachnospiraceae bacterium]